MANNIKKIKNFLKKKKVKAAVEKTKKFLRPRGNESEVMANLMRI
jgi:hypothetical protein